MYIIGQRWISEVEPELGLGTILKIDNQYIYCLVLRRLQGFIHPKVPLKRAVFRVGDKVKDKDDNELKIVDIEDEGDLLVYYHEAGNLVETDLSDTLSFSEPHDRLLKQHLDDHQLFNLRYSSYKHQNRIKSSPVYGYSGARIDLIPHQLYVARKLHLERIREFYYQMKLVWVKLSKPVWCFIVRF